MSRRRGRRQRANLISTSYHKKQKRDEMSGRRDERVRDILSSGRRAVMTTPGYGRYVPIIAYDYQCRRRAQGRLGLRDVLWRTALRRLGLVGAAPRARIVRRPARRTCKMTLTTYIGIALQAVRVRQVAGKRTPTRGTPLSPNRRKWTPRCRAG